MSRRLTKTAPFMVRLCLEHPKVPNKPRLLSRGTRKDFLIEKGGDTIIKEKNNYLNIV